MQKKIIQQQFDECLSTDKQILYTIKTFGEQVESIVESLSLPDSTFSPNVKTRMLFILTDDADIFEKEINLLLYQEKGMYVHPFVFDINEKGENKQKHCKEWPYYNILPGKIIGNLFFFIEYYLNNVGLISFDLNDFRWALSSGIFLNITKLEGDINQIITSFQPKKCKTLVLGISIPNQGDSEMQKILNIINDFFSQFGDETEIKWVLNFCEDEPHALIIEVFETETF